MPATKDGPASCTSGGEYKAVQLCIGAPRCQINSQERENVQKQKGGCGMCRHEWMFVMNNGEISPRSSVLATRPRLQHGDLVYDNMVLQRGNFREPVSPMQSRIIEVLMTTDMVPSARLCETIGKVDDPLTMMRVKKKITSLREKLGRLGYSIIYKNKSYGLIEL